jgi:accessory gene regulator B
MKKVITRLADRFVRKGIISEEDKVVYEFGIYQGMTLTINLLTILIVGYLFNEIFSLIAFSVFYLSIRSYAGGYHADTELRCYLVSTAMLLIVVYILKYVSISPYALMITLCFSITSLVLLAPVENHSKPLDDLEKKVYRSRTLKIMVLQLCVMVISYFIMMELFKVIVISFGMIAVILHLGCIKNRVYFLIENY